MTPRGWSTRQLAELAGTSVKTVRHYHAVGLLDEPERLSNGYKQYQVAHLLQLLRVRRLADLGVPLAEVGPIIATGDDPGRALAVLDAELESTIARLQHIRAELRTLLSHGSRTDVPDGFGAVGGDLTETGRKMLMIYSRVFDASTMAAMRRVFEEGATSETDAELEALPSDADDDTRQALAVRIAEETRRRDHRQPELKALARADPSADPRAAQAITSALHQLYTPAQIDVLARVRELLLVDADNDAADA